MSTVASPVKDEASVNGEVSAFDNLKSYLEDYKQKNPDADIQKLLSEEVAKNPELQEEVLKDADSFIKKLSGELETPPEPDKPAESKPEETPPETKPEEKLKEKLSVEVDPETLGTYKDVEAMSKGNKEKDLTIDFFKKEKIPGLEQRLAQAEQERQSLKKEIEEFKKAKTEKKAIPPKVDIKEIKVPEPKDGDYITDEDYHKNLRQSLVESIEQNKSLLSIRDEMKNEIESLKSGIEEIKTSTETEHAKSQRQNQIDTEFDEIDRLRKRNEVFEYKRSIEDIENDYMEFLENLKIAADVKEPVLDKNGNFSPEIAGAVSTYNDEKKGEDLRKKCESKGIKLPDDFKELNTVYGIRKIRNEMAERDPATGEYKPISYERAFKLYQSENTSLEDIKLQERKAGHEAYEKAVNKSKDFAKETPPASGAPPFDISKYTQPQLETMVRELVAKGEQRTEPETITLKEILKAAQMSEKEINEYIT